MAIVLIAGSADLVGSESIRSFCSNGLSVVDIHYHRRQSFWGKDTLTKLESSKSIEAFYPFYLAHRIAKIL